MEKHRMREHIRAALLEAVKQLCFKLNAELEKKRILKHIRRIQQGIVEQHVDEEVQQELLETVDVVRFAPQEHIQQQIVDVTMPQVRQESDEAVEFPSQ